MKKCIIFLAGFALLLAGCPRVGGEGTKSYTVKFSATPADGGSLTAKIKGGAAFTSGKTVLAETVLEFTATPKDGYKVEKWAGVTADPKENTKATLKVTKDADVKVFFVKNSTEPSEPPADEKYTVTYSHTPADGGSLTAKIKGGAAFTSGSKVPVNTVLEFTATPKDGYKVEKWEGVTADPKDRTKATLKVTKDADVKVFFVKNSTEPSEPPAGEKYTVTYSRTPTEGGSLTAKIKGGADFKSGSEVPVNTVLEFTATPKDGYRVKEWTGATADTTDNTKATLTVTKEVNVTVTFVRNGTPTPPTPPPSSVEKYTVTYSHTPDEGGSLTAKRKDSGASVASGSNVPENTIIEFTAAPKDGYRVKEWTGATVSAADKTKAVLTVTGNADVKVSFEIIPKYTVTFSAEPKEGGNLTAKIKDGGASVQSGDKLPAGTVVLFTAEPKTEGNGYYIFGWSGEDLKVSSNKTTAELTVKKDTEVKVMFQEYLVENPNWDAVGILTTKDGKMKKFHMVISDGGKYFSFFDNSPGGGTYLAAMTYDKSTKTVTLKQPLGEGSIRFVLMKDFTPSEWEIEFRGVKVGDLELQNQTATINVTFNKDNFIH